MYDTESYLVANPINRYALGDRSGLNYADDGSLTIYIQSDSPARQGGQLAARTQGRRVQARPAPLRAQAGGRGRHLGSAGDQAGGLTDSRTANNPVELTAYSVRSCVAPASGSSSPGALLAKIGP